MSVPPRLIKLILCEGKGSFDNVEVKIILAFQPFRRIFPNQIMVAKLQRRSAFTKGNQTSD